MTPLTAMRTAIEVTLSKPERTPEQLEAMAARVKRSIERAECFAFREYPQSADGNDHGDEGGAEPVVL